MVAKTCAPSPGHVHFDTSFELARAAQASVRTAPFLSRILPVPWCIHAVISSLVPTRKRAKAATKTRASWPWAPNPARPPPPQRRGPAARKRLDSGARTCRGNTDIANTTYKTAAACPWLVRAAPFCAKTRVLHSASAAACRGTTPRGTHYPWCDKARRATQVPLFALHATTSNSARARFGSWWRKRRRLTPHAHLDSRPSAHSFLFKLACARALNRPQNRPKRQTLIYNPAHPQWRALSTALWYGSKLGRTARNTHPTSAD